MIKKAKTILLLTILLFGLFLFINFAKAGVTGTWEEEATLDRALEIVYPQIPGYTTEKVVFSGLPEYIEYIFRFSIWLIGFVILGALIYAGFQYFTSFGNPEKLSAAKNGITSAFLGGIILLGAVLIFNTINPQLVILEAPPLDILAPTVMPGIYLCNYKPSNVRGPIEYYLYGTKEEKIEAAKKLTEIMKNGKNVCFRVMRSANLNFEFDPNLHDIFVIPRIDYVFDPENPSEPKTTPINDFGLMFHQKDNFVGKYFLAVIYPEDIATYPNFSARSVTLFQKPDQEPDSSNRGAILYQCLDYNEGGFCPEGLKGTPDERSFKPGGNDYIAKVAPADLGPNLRAKFKKGGLWDTADVPDGPTGTRSIRIDPVSSYFALLFNGEHFGDDSTLCEVISMDDPNLLDNKIGQCGYYCKMTSETPGKDWFNKNCGPCLKSMIVIKGKVIK